jgi:hypothetical protein
MHVMPEENVALVLMLSLPEKHKQQTAMRTLILISEKADPEKGTFSGASNNGV